MTKVLSASWQATDRHRLHRQKYIAAQTIQYIIIQYERQGSVDTADTD